MDTLNICAEIFEEVFFSLKVIKMVLRGAIGNHMSLIIVGRACVCRGRVDLENKQT